MPLPWTQTDIDELKAAIATGKGAKQMTFGDQTVVFHSIQDMLDLLGAMQNDVAASGTSTKSSFRYAVTSKGI